MQEAGRLIVNGFGTEKTLYKRAIIPEQNIIYQSDKKKVEVSWRNNFDRMKEIAQAWKELYPYQDETHVNAPAEYSGLPFLVWWASDMHIGNVDTEYKLLTKHIDLIENTKNTGLVTLGKNELLLGLVPVSNYIAYRIMEELKKRRLYQSVKIRRLSCQGK